MTITTDPTTGLPIIGGTGGAPNPVQEAQERILAIAREKSKLAADDHDWHVLISYHLSEADAERLHLAGKTGIPATPAILTVPQLVRGSVGPLCDKCGYRFEEVGEMPCPGMRFEEYLATLPEEIQTQIVELLKSGAIPEGGNFDVDPDTHTVYVVNAQGERIAEARKPEAKSEETTDA